jgi:hypothetical protein
MIIFRVNRPWIKCDALQVRANARSADEAKVVVHECADGKDVGGVDAGANDLQPDLIVLGPML